MKSSTLAGVSLSPLRRNFDALLTISQCISGISLGQVCGGAVGEENMIGRVQLDSLVATLDNTYTSVRKNEFQGYVEGNRGGTLV